MQTIRRSDRRVGWMPFRPGCAGGEPADGGTACDSAGVRCRSTQGTGSRHVDRCECGDSAGVHYGCQPGGQVNFTSIRIADHALIRTITLHRPERRNAMTPEMQKELIAALEDTARSTAR